MSAKNFESLDTEHLQNTNSLTFTVYITNAVNSREVGQVLPSTRERNAILPVMRPDLNALDSANYLHLRELSEPRENSLRLVVQEAIVNADGLVQPHPNHPELEEVSRGGSPIESTEACRTFELT
jgi:hypothetical protein